MSEFDGFIDDELSEDEADRLRRAFQPPKSKVPGTYKNRIKGLVALEPDELPIVGKHYVVWGNAYFSDIKARPVKRPAKMSEDEHALKALELLDGGLKNPKVWTDPQTGTSLDDSSAPGAVEWGRLDRANRYARWRYRGFVAGEIQGL